MALDITKSYIPPCVAEGKILVVDSKQVLNSGPEIVDIHLPIDHVVAEFVSRSIDKSRFGTASGQPDTESKWVVIPSITAL